MKRLLNSVKKILILGSSGMLGHVAMLRLEELGYSAFGLSKSRQIGRASILLDVTSADDFHAFLDANTFDVIVNCIALLVCASERQKDLAIYLNTYLPRFLEAKYSDTDVKIIHVSTDSVFSGNKAPYCENSPHDSSGFYGRSKYLGEISNRKDLTVRSAFWGPDINEASPCIFNWALKQRETMNGYTNHIFNGVSSLEFSLFLHLAIRYDLTGIYHLTAKYPISKCDFLLYIKRIFGLNNEVVPTEVRHVDRSLISGRSTVPYAGADYLSMLTACKEWIERRRELYPHYKLYDWEAD